MTFPRFSTRRDSHTLAHTRSAFGAGWLGRGKISNRNRFSASARCLVAASQCVECCVVCTCCKTRASFATMLWKNGAYVALFVVSQLMLLVVFCFLEGIADVAPTRKVPRLGVRGGEIKIEKKYTNIYFNSHTQTLK